jgi:hypothetical protein
MKPVRYRIRENTMLARVSAWKLGKPRCATVIGSTIYLWGISKNDFMADAAYLRHEQQHILQYRQYGILRFLALYIIESLRKGYYKNRFEVEARNAETKPHSEEFLLS